MTAAPQPAGQLSHPALTGLRGVAALLVIATHAAFWTGHYRQTYTGWFAARLEIGVAVFFVLSGFLLMRPWLRTPAPRAASYVRNRALRVLPVYWVTVLAVYVVYAFRHADPGGEGLRGLVQNLTLTQLYAPGQLHTGLTQMWSLTVEVCFYLLLPLIGYLTRWVRPLLLCAACAAVTPIWLVWVHSLPLTQHSVLARLWFPAFSVWFAAGMALAVLESVVTRVVGWLAVSVAGVLFLATCSPIAGEPTLAPLGLAHALTKAVLYAVISALVVAASIGTGATRNGSWRHLLGSAPLRWLGEISYELFLVHLVVLDFVMSQLGYSTFTGSAFGVFVCTTVVSIPLAWALHRFISIPLTHFRANQYRGKIGT